MKIFNTVFLLTSLCLASTTHAEVLWNNGPYLESTVGQGNQIIMDDVYVPGAGWFVNEVESHGIFMSGNATVDQVDVTIWLADIQTGEPDTELAVEFDHEDLNVVVTDTGDDMAGSNIYKVNVSFPDTFLKGQRYYWIELDIQSSTGQRFSSLRTQHINYLPGFTYFNGALCPHDTDLAFKLFGSNIHMIDVGTSDDLVIEKPIVKKGTVSFQIKGEHKIFEPGFMQLSLVDRQPVLIHHDRNGQKKLDFKANPKGPQKLNTPVGDDMCADAPGSLYEYCQTLIACAAYELACPSDHTIP